MGRARLIEAQGAEIVWVRGTYDDAVDAAAEAARDGAGILVADTTDDPDDPVVADVMAGYGVMAAEIRHQAAAAAHARPTHLFVQAGVGGLAAALAQGLTGWMASPARIVAVEPGSAAGVQRAMRAGQPVRLTGDLLTAAEMLACGQASAAVLGVLRHHDVTVLSVSEASLAAAPAVLRSDGGPATTPSGAAGLAGAITASASDGACAAFHLGPASRLLILVTEAELDVTD